MMTYGIFAILVILIVIALAIVLVAWFISSSPAQPSAKRDVKTQPIVQKFYSNNLTKRAFIVHRNDDRYKVIYQRYSDKIINQRGEIIGWQTQPEKPITDSLSSAVEIAQEWVHKKE